MTIREYFYNNEMTTEEFEARAEEENNLWNALEMVGVEDVDKMLEQWCIEHNIDINAEEDGIKITTLWLGDMCED